MAVVMENRCGRGVNRLRKAVWGTALCLLLLPLMAMQFPIEVNWSGEDFGVMGVLLFAACAVYELGAWLSDNSTYRAAYRTAVLGGFLLIWINLAVGMIGSEDNPYNLWFGAVLGIAIVGAMISRFRANGMALAMLAAALVHVSIAMVALLAGWDSSGSKFSSGFAVIWLIAAALFRKAARGQTLVGAAR